MDRLPFAFYQHLSESLTKEEVERLSGIFPSYRRSHCWKKLLEAKKEEKHRSLRILLKSENGALQGSLQCWKEPQHYSKDLSDVDLGNIRFDSVICDHMLFTVFEGETKFRPLLDLQSQLKFVVSRFTSKCSMMITQQSTSVAGFSEFMRNHRFLTEFRYGQVSLEKGTEESIFEFFEFQVNHGQLKGIRLGREWPQKTDALLQEAVEQEQLKEFDIYYVRGMEISKRLDALLRSDLRNLFWAPKSSLQQFSDDDYRAFENNDW